MNALGLYAVVTALSHQLLLLSLPVASAVVDAISQSEDSRNWWQTT